MTKTSVELSKKASGYMLAASNAAKREINEKTNNNNQTVIKTTVTKTTVTKTTATKKK